MAAQHRDHDIGGAQGRDLFRQVLVIGGRGDEHGVASFGHMDYMLDRLEGSLCPAPVIGVVSSPRIDVPFHDIRTSEGWRRTSRINRGSRPSPFARSQSLIRDRPGAPRFLNSLTIFPISQPVQWLSAAAGLAIQYVWAPTGPDDATTCRSRLHWKGLAECRA